MTPLRYDFETAQWIAREPDEPEAPPFVPRFDLAENARSTVDIEMVNVRATPRWQRFLRLPLHLIRLRACGLSVGPALKMAWICVWM